jgi:2-keto-4-pentenoate hydratase
LLSAAARTDIVAASGGEDHNGRSRHQANDRGRSGDVMGNPSNALARLADKTAARGGRVVAEVEGFGAAELIAV